MYLKITLTKMCIHYDIYNIYCYFQQSMYLKITLLTKMCITMIIIQYILLFSAIYVPDDNATD